MSRARQKYEAPQKKSGKGAPGDVGKTEYSRGQGKLKGRERLRLATHLDRVVRRTVEWQVGLACEAAPSGLADCAHYTAEIVSVRWKRDNHKLRLLLLVRVNGFKGEQVFRWRYEINN